MELNYKEMGHGEPLIILHGLFGMLDNWQTLAKRFAAHYMVFVVDQRNHGRSMHAAPMDYPTMAEDLHNFMMSHWIHHAHILGHSMGGKTAMEFALRYPEMVDQLIVVDIAPKAYQGGHQDIFDALFSLDLQQISSRSDAEQLLQERIKDFGVRQFLLKNLTRNKAGGYRWKMNLPVLYNHYQDILTNLDDDRVCESETLFIRGGASKYVEDEDILDIMELFPNSQIATIPEAGHWVHADAPDTLFEEVTAFLH